MKLKSKDIALPSSYLEIVINSSKDKLSGFHTYLTTAERDFRNVIT